jgi:hypothetical protein
MVRRNMSKQSDQTPKPDLTAFNEAAENLSKAGQKLGEEASKLPSGTVPGVSNQASSTHSHSSTTTHDSVKTHNGVIVSEEHWTKTTGETQPETEQ